MMALSLLPLNALAKDVWSAEYDRIRIYLDNATNSDLEALNGVSDQVRIVSSKYSAEQGMRPCAPLSGYWETPNHFRKVTAKDIASIDLAGDKLIGSSNKISIPIQGDETYEVKVSDGYHKGYTKIDSYSYLRIDILKRTPEPPVTAYPVYVYAFFAHDNTPLTGDVTVNGKKIEWNENANFVTLGVYQNGTTQEPTDSALELDLEALNVKEYAPATGDGSGKANGVVLTDITSSPSSKVCSGAAGYPDSEGKLSWHLDGQVNVYTVSYNNNDGTAQGAPTSNGYYFGSYTIADAPTRDGYTFTGWKDNDDTVYQAGEKIDKLNKDLNLVAQWTARTDLSYTVNHLWGNESISSTTDAANYNDVITIINPTIDGYTLIPGQTMSMTIGTGENVLNLKYRKNVTLTANSDTKTYDGTKHTVTGYTAKDNKDNLVEGLTFTGVDSPSVSGTDVGKYDVEFSGSAVGAHNELYIVTAVNPGKLTINKRSVTLTSESASKVYDGTPLTRPNVTVGGDGFVEGEVTDIRATGSVTNVSEGEVTNTIKYTPTDKFKADNYDITKTEGKLTITEASAPAPATVTLKETDVNGNALINKHLTVTAKEAETIKDAYFCVAVTAANDATEAVFTAEPRYATTTKVKDMTRTSDGTAVEGSFVFPKESVLTFTEAGTYTFTVKEVFDEYIKVNHTTYDDTKYTMIVEVEKDATENKLNATVSFTKGEKDPTGSITFNNTYKTPVIPTYTFDLSDLDTITVNKEFVSKYGRSATMSFEATATIEKEKAYIITDSGINTNVSNNGSAATAEPTYEKVVEAAGIVTLKTDKTGVFQFSGTYDLKPGNYRITVKETKGSDRYYVTYDDTTYTYDFIVNDKGEISIKTPITCTFTNVYTKRHTAAAPSKPTLNTGDHYAYVMGYPDGTVRPNGSITRAEVSAILFRLLSDKTRDEYFTTESSFTDVKAGAWYNNSIATLEKAGVIVDTAKGGAFRPNEAITRAELAAMLAQFSDAKPVKGVKFSDVPAEHWAYEAIAIAAKMGWIEGYPDGTFRPDATITRAEMMTLVNRALERVPSDEDHLLSKRVMLTFPDCKSGDWFYIAVQEATNSHTYERAATEKNGDEQWTALRANRDWTLLEK